MNDTEEFATKTLGCLVAVCFVVVMVIVSALMNGWVLVKLWGWFVVPLFPVPQLALTQAIGLGLVVSFLTHQSQPNDKDESVSDALVRMATSAVVTPLICLLVGYVVHQYQ